MKRFILLLVCCAALFASCITTTNTFSSTEKQVLDNMIISVDEFTEKSTAEIKPNGCDFTVGLSYLDIEPVFIYDDECVSVLLRIRYDHYGSKAGIIEKVILLGENNKVQILFTEKANITVRDTDSLLGNDYSVVKNQPISKEDYLNLTKFFSDNANIRLAIYLADNTVAELKPYSKRPQATFDTAFSFYQKTLQDKNALPIKNAILFK